MKWFVHQCFKPNLGGLSSADIVVKLNKSNKLHWIFLRGSRLERAEALHTFQIYICKKI